MEGQKLTSPEYRRDIYDGKTLKDFLNFIFFLRGDCNIAFMLNIDWFHRFKYTQYSVGAVYLSIMNLPHKIRLKGQKMSFLYKCCKVRVNQTQMD